MEAMHHGLRDLFVVIVLNSVKDSISMKRITMGHRDILEFIIYSYWFLNDIIGFVGVQL
ncbi:hypothetical protein ES332_D12G156900v1 [Gossypium tomentosum]|uniref:Uncharacterized protein n=1 Tax=Gossypium tomentosum TaxID=34277 RepID=A0A5D2I933_GOSTO|nr:hypothetical protein ES332_D12G156900v1 [Gossypium tomentosum]